MNSLQRCELGLLVALLFPELLQFLQAVRVIRYIDQLLRYQLVLYVLALDAGQLNKLLQLELKTLW